MARPRTRTPDFYFSMAEEAAANHRWSTAVHYAGKGLALFPSTGMKAPMMRLSAEYRQKRSEWMADAAKDSEKTLKEEVANDRLPDPSVGQAFPEEFKAWKGMTFSERMDVLNRSATPAGHYKRLTVCMITIRKDLKSLGVVPPEEEKSVRRRDLKKKPVVPSEKEIFKALNRRKAATKRRMGMA
jgi:hypothetical protein